MKYLIIKCLRFYQRVHIVFFRGCCRFYPSCSNYAIEAIEVHGCIKGLALTAWRILRCQPFCKSGYDPVPPLPPPHTP